MARQLKYFIINDEFHFYNGQRTDGSVIWDSFTNNPQMFTNEQGALQVLSLLEDDGKLKDDKGYFILPGFIKDE